MSLLLSQNISQKTNKQLLLFEKQNLRTERTLMMHNLKKFLSDITILFTSKINTFFSTYSFSSFFSDERFSILEI